MSDLQLFHGPSETLADRMRAAVQAEGLEALVKDAKAHVRTALRDAVDAESERTGTSFTAKLDGWSAQMTDPDPRPSVTDRAAFGHWLRADFVDRVEVVDHEAAAEAIHAVAHSHLFDDDQLHNALCSLAEHCLKVVTEYVLPEDPFTPLIDSGRCKIVGNPDDGYLLVDTETGEQVPGATVTRQDPQLRLVPKGKAQRAAARRDVAELLGIPAEIGGR